MQNNFVGFYRLSQQENGGPSGQSLLSCCGSNWKSPKDAGAMAQASSDRTQCLLLHLFPLSGMDLRAVTVESFQNN